MGNANLAVPHAKLKKKREHKKLELNLILMQPNGQECPTLPKFARFVEFPFTFRKPQKLTY